MKLAVPDPKQKLMIDRAQSHDLGLPPLDFRYRLLDYDIENQP